MFFIYFKLVFRLRNYGTKDRNGRNHSLNVVKQNTDFHTDDNNTNFRILIKTLVATKGKTKLPSLCGSKTYNLRLTTQKKPIPLKPILQPI